MIATTMIDIKRSWKQNKTYTLMPLSCSCHEKKHLIFKLTINL